MPDRLSRQPGSAVRPTVRHALRSALVTVLAGLLLWATAGSVAGAGLRSADPAPTRVRAVTTGYDISYPQCGQTFPGGGAFRVVGVNGGIVFAANRCLGPGEGPSQLAWAGRDAQLYANTGNPGPALSRHWPLGQASPRACPASRASADTADCAYDYGWNAAADSYATAVRAYVALGWAVAGARRTPVANRWWLDVETANSWRSNPELNVAALRGAVAYLRSVGAASIGLYSTPRMWRAITGGTRAFDTNLTWVAGATGSTSARSMCVSTGFTGGRVTMVQYVAGGFDVDRTC